MVRAGAAVIVALAVGLSAGGPMSSRSAAQTNRASLSCSRTLVALVNTLAAIDHELSVGVNFDDYETLVRAGHVAYGRVTWKSLPHACVVSVEAASEDALNAYTAAYNSWLQCVRKVDAKLLTSCTSGPGNTFRQRQWHIAQVSEQRAANALFG